VNKTIALEGFLENIDFFIDEAQAWKIFVYPTDTVYGIGWIYRDDIIEKIFEIKKRDKAKRFSIIAPDFEFIIQNYNLPSEFPSKADLEKQLEKYHWVTWIFDYKKPGVRIIKHDIQKFVKKLWNAFITTSLNISGEPVIRDLTNLPVEIEKNVDYTIDAWILSWKPSVLIDFVADKIIER